MIGMWGAYSKPELAAISELEEMSDRAAGIVAGTLLDKAVELIIRNELIKTDGDYVDDLFNGTNPLATFSAKIKFAYAMGLISAEARQDLDILRGIRNHFAHALTAESFNIDPIKSRCLSLKLVDQHVVIADGWSNPEPTPKKLADKHPILQKPRQRYFLSINILTAGMQLRNPRPHGNPYI